ncbi:hypothetical protein ACNKHW_03485 [Shigella flexneri]
MHLFLVKEDSSALPHEDRLDLALKGTADITPDPASRLRIHHLPAPRSLATSLKNRASLTIVTPKIH